MKMSKKMLILAVSIIVGIVLIIIIFSSLGNKKTEPKEYVTDNNAEVNPKDKEDVDKLPEEKTEEDEDISSDDVNVYKPYERKKVLLNSQEEELVVDENFKITFAGTKEDYDIDRYTYNALYYINDKPVKPTVFNDVAQRHIYSYNHGAEFYVDRIDDVYIITSHLNKKYDGYYVSLLNTEGEILREFNDVTMEVMGNMITIYLHTDSMTTIETRFKIEGNKVNIQYDPNEN